MDFGLSQDQILLKQTIARFLAEKCPTSRVRQIMDTPDAHDRELWKGVVDLGLPALYVPTEHGGAGQELLDLALAAEELGFAAAPGPLVASALAAIALVEGGDASQQSQWLPHLADGSAIGSFALGEADGEWRFERLTATVKDGKLSGEKWFAPYGALADLVVVAASDEQGLGLFLARKGDAGFSAVDLRTVDETRRLSKLTFRDTPVARLPGGAQALARTRDAGLVLVAADAFGGCRRMLDMTIEYVKTREQFGQPIAAFQAVKHQLANLAAELEPTLSLWWYAAHAFDRIRDESEQHAAMAKALLCDVYDRFARDTTELHGGIGFTWEYDLQLWFKRAILDRGAFGESSLHRARAADLAGW